MHIRNGKAEQISRDHQARDGAIFRYFGLGPNLKIDRDGIPFVFNRNEYGLLGHFLALPESYGCDPNEYALEHGTDKGEKTLNDIQVYFKVGGYNRIGGDMGFGLLLNLIKLRWWPELQISDDYDVCGEGLYWIEKCGLMNSMKNEQLQFPACWDLFVSEYQKHNPPRPPALKQPKLVIADPKAREIRLEELELSIRTSRCLAMAQIKTIGELEQCTEKDLMGIKYFGRKSLYEVMDLLGDYGLHLQK